MIRHLTMSAVLAATLALAACGGDEPNSGRATAPATTAQTGDVERYCALVQELDTAGEKFFSGLGEDASPKEYEAAERRFIEEFQPKLSELEQAAPPQIADDVDTLLASMRDRAGLKTATDVTEQEASAAERRIKAFEKRECGAS